MPRILHNSPRKLYPSRIPRVNKSYLYVIPIALVVGLYVSLIFFKASPIQLRSALWLGEQAQNLPPFALTDHNGGAFNNETIKGKWHLWFFGYTHCPDICPDTLQLLTSSVAQIDEATREQLQVTFISVDPERDTLDKMKEYVTYFNPDFMSARAERERLMPLTQALGIYHSVEKSEDGNKYDVAHSGVLIIITPDGRFSGLFSPPLDGTNIAHDISALINR